ncbi:MAG TPA: hypothetical protein VLZ83_11270, partial [Edaphocola sp.]|nr:hypothetical protein [Edaphocola sp.]
KRQNWSIVVTTDVKANIQKLNSIFWDTRFNLVRLNQGKQEIFFLDTTVQSALVQRNVLPIRWKI